MTAPLPIREAIVVEGRYDKAAVAAVADTLILETAGFGVFKDAERLAQLEGPFPSAPQIRHGELSIDLLRHTVTMRDEPVSLTVKEFDILHFLASYPGIVFTKSQIYERVWEEDFKFASTSVSDHISSLRQKLGLNARDGRYIQTVFGVGYRFVAEPSGS